MDENSLRRLANGFPDLDALENLWLWCWDRGETTGQARYCSVSRSLEMIHRAWEDQGELPHRVGTALRQAFNEAIPLILDETPESGSLFARTLRETVSAILTSWYQTK
jgi:hypothetical protein